jgi:DNA-binding transcriptional MerR regulator
MLFKIGDFSRISRVSIRTLRYYDEISLLRPVQVDQATGYRYYSIEQLPEINRINMLKNIGLSLEDIQELLNDAPPVDYIRQLLQVKKSEIQERISLDKEKLRKVEIWLNRASSEGILPTDIHIQRKTVPALRVISKREIGTYDETTDRILSELRQQLDRPGNIDSVKITGPVMGIFYDDEYKELDADIEAAIPISGELSVIEEGFEVKTLPKIEGIFTIYKGPVYHLNEIYAQIIDYAEQHNLKLLTPIRELYLTYPEADLEDGLIIEIQCPFKSP